VDEHERSSGPDRKSIAPEPERGSEPDCRGGHRVRGLAWELVAGPRHPDDERVERLGERGVSERDPPQECLRMSYRRPAGVRGRRYEPTALPPENGAPERIRERGDDLPQRGTSKPLDHLELVRVPAIGAREAGKVEHE
jgi:hypothetical protein